MRLRMHLLGVLGQKMGLADFGIHWGGAPRHDERLVWEMVLFSLFPPLLQQQSLVRML